MPISAIPIRSPYSQSMLTSPATPFSAENRKLTLTVPGDDRRIYRNLKFNVSLRWQPYQVSPVSSIDTATLAQCETVEQLACGRLAHIHKASDFKLGGARADSPSRCWRPPSVELDCRLPLRAVSEAKTGPSNRLLPEPSGPSPIPFAAKAHQSRDWSRSLLS